MKLTDKNILNAEVSGIEIASSNEPCVSLLVARNCRDYELIITATEIKAMHEALSGTDDGESDIVRQQRLAIATLEEELTKAQQTIDELNQAWIDQNI